jgi:hypothetical protein
MRTKAQIASDAALRDKRLMMVFINGFPKKVMSEDIFKLTEGQMSGSVQKGLVFSDI